MDYGDFRTEYMNRFPSKVPKRREIIHAYPRWLAAVVMAMFITSAVLSGVHTVPTTYLAIEDSVPEIVRAMASVGSFVSVEIAIFVSAYLMLSKDSRKWAWIVLFLSGAVAIGANLYSSSKAFEENTATGVIFVAYVMGICMPAIALVSGKLFVNIHRAERQLKMEVEDEYRSALITFDEEVDNEYQKERSKLDRRTRRAPVSGMSIRTGQRTDSGQVSGYGYNRTADAKELVRRHLEANPEDFNLSVRMLADKLEVGKSTVADVRRVMQEPVLNGHTNGHNGSDDGNRTTT